LHCREIQSPRSRLLYRVSLRFAAARADPLLEAHALTWAKLGAVACVADVHENVSAAGVRHDVKWPHERVESFAIVTGAPVSITRASSGDDERRLAGMDAGGRFLSRPAIAVRKRQA
jgi:hypothetical protein